DGDGGCVGGDGAGGAEGGGGEVAEGHGGGFRVVDVVADPPGELCAQGGDAGAEVSADPLPADDQVDAERAAELGDPQQPGGRLADLVFLGLVGHQEQLGDLVHQDHDRHRPDWFGKPPDVACAVLAAGPHPVSEQADQVVEQIATLAPRGGQGRQPRGVGGELDTAFEIEPGQRDRLRGQ